MTTRSRRGGYQRPTSPAPVSGPGALSERTDGGAAQPIRELPAEATGGYGTRQEFTDQQAAAPIPQVDGGAAPGPAVMPSGVPAGAFGPTENPGQPLTAGQAPTPILAPDPLALTRAIYAVAPNSALLRVIQWMERNQ